MLLTLLFHFLVSQVWEVAEPYIEKYRREHVPEWRPISPTAFSLGSLEMNTGVSHDHGHQDELQEYGANGTEHIPVQDLA